MSLMAFCLVRVGCRRGCAKKCHWPGISSFQSFPQFFFFLPSKAAHSRLPSRCGAIPSPAGKMWGAQSHFQRRHPAQIQALVSRVRPHPEPEGNGSIAEGSCVPQERANFQQIRDAASIAWANVSASYSLVKRFLFACRKTHRPRKGETHPNLTVLSRHHSGAERKKVRKLITQKGGAPIRQSVNSRETLASGSASSCVADQPQDTR